MSLKILTLLILVINYVYGKQERIIGGSYAQRYDFPYQAVLKRISDNVIICGGAILSHYHIITAAHCVDEHSVPQNNLMINLGGVNQTHLFTAEHFPRHIMIHSGYVRGLPDELSHKNDIAVIRTREKIVFDQYQNPILLPDRNIQYGIYAKHSGWGSVAYPMLSFPYILQTVEMEIMYPITCQKKVPIDLHGDQFCAFKAEGIGPCFFAVLYTVSNNIIPILQGDGGNPLVKDNKVIGIFSMSYLCASGVPDIYTNVYAHIPFITSAIST